MVLIWLETYLWSIFMAFQGISLGAVAELLATLPDTEVRMLVTGLMGKSLKNWENPIASPESTV